jgi:hypothetical protein
MQRAHGHGRRAAYAGIGHRIGHRASSGKIGHHRASSMMANFFIVMCPPSPIFPTPSVITPAKSQKSQKNKMAGKEWCGPSI